MNNWLAIIIAAIIIAVAIAWSATRIADVFDRGCRPGESARMCDVRQKLQNEAPH